MCGEFTDRCSLTKGYALLITFLYLLQIDVLASLLSGRLVRERIGPAMLSAVQSQVTINMASCSLQDPWLSKPLLSSSNIQLHLPKYDC